MKKYLPYAPIAVALLSLVLWFAVANFAFRENSVKECTVRYMGQSPNGPYGEWLEAKPDEPVEFTADLLRVRLTGCTGYWDYTRYFDEYPEDTQIRGNVETKDQIEQIEMVEWLGPVDHVLVRVEGKIYRFDRPDWINAQMGDQWR